MNKLIEELAGIGEVFENDNSLGKVNYQIKIFLEMVNADTFGAEEEEEGLQQITGKISSDSLLQLISKNLTLLLEDGRKIEFFVENRDGDVQFSGDFF